MLVCRATGCQMFACTRGWCNKHYIRWRKHGDVAVDNTRRTFVPENRNCTICQAVLVRGREEYPSAFMRRRTCGGRCARQASKQTVRHRWANHISWAERLAADPTAKRIYLEHRGRLKKQRRDVAPPEELIKTILKRREKQFGLSPEVQLAMYTRQGGKCAICDKPIRWLPSRGYGSGNGTASLDHNHKTGKARGFLCGHCNRGIGYLGDSVERFQRAIAYLLEHAS